MEQADRDDIHKLASYPEKTAGALMTSGYATLTWRILTRTSEQLFN